MKVSDLTLKEKLHLFTGDDNPVLSAIMAVTYLYNRKPVAAGALKQHAYQGIQFTDGPRGVVMGNSTCYPVAMARAASWDTELEEDIGRAIGLESRAQGANIWAGVCINLVRHPAWGRAQESYGEDPVLLGRMGVAALTGAQHHVMACIKHFALNNIEIARFKVDVSIDERALHELYLPHFKQCVDAGAASVMSAYNKVNGHYCGENNELLTDILKNQWGFKGFVMSDFVLGVRDGVKGFNAGLDLEMPFKWRFHSLPRGIRKHKIGRERIDDAAHRLTDTFFRFEKLRKDSYPSIEELRQQHSDLALTSAQRSMVLLKNIADENGESLLPIKNMTGKTIALIGKRAEDKNIGDHGSSNVRALNVDTIKSAFVRLQPAEKLLWNDGDSISSAVKTARSADIVILVAGYKHNEEGEYIPPRGGDRKSLRLSAHQEALISAVTLANPATVVVVVAGSAVVTPWSDATRALLMAWYPGQAGGQALWDILSGAVNPCGKLPVVFPQEESHTPFFDRNAKAINYDHFHGYRYLDKHALTPRFAFGFGLSYTQFSLGDPVLNRSSGEHEIRLSVTIENTGSREGATVIQCYASYDNKARELQDIERPSFELKDFCRINLAAKESKTIEFLVSARYFACYRPDSKDWFTPAGNYLLHVGSSSRMQDLKSIEYQMLDSLCFCE